MTPTMKSLGIDRLSIPDRLAVVQEIWDSIALSPEQIPVSEAEYQEFDRHLADLEANPDKVMTWQEIKARVRGQR